MTKEPDTRAPCAKASGTVTPSAQRLGLRRGRAGGPEHEQLGQRAAPLRRATIASGSAETEGQGVIPPVVHYVLRTPGIPLAPTLRASMEPAFGRDLSRVRVHTGAIAAASARSVGALAYTVGHDVVFGSGQYAPHTGNGRLLLAHELAHTIQQGEGVRSALGGAEPGSVYSEPSLEREADRVALQVVSGHRATGVTAAPGAPALQRQRSPVTLRSPVFEETVTQLSDAAGAAGGRGLTRGEQALARPVFGTSIDLARVRLVTLEALEFRTVGNNIYIPPDFTIADAYMARTLIHELTHVWQYQHRGTSYISESLTAQIDAAMTRGSRNFAYDYRIRAGQSFFDFSAEQQGLMVENYFAMQRDEQAIPADQAAGVMRTYHSNHMASDDFPAALQAAQRLSEIAAELPMHEPLMQQMRAAWPLSQIELLHLRATDVVRSPLDELTPPERRMTPLRPLLELRF